MCYLGKAWSGCGTASLAACSSYTLLKCRQLELTWTCLFPRALRQTGAVRKLGARTAYHWKTGGDKAGPAGLCNGTNPDGDTGRLWVSATAERTLADSPLVESVAVDSASEKVSASESTGSDDRCCRRSSSNIAGQEGRQKL